MKLNSVDEILDLAIKREAGAAKFYADLAARSTSEEMKKVFEDFSKEEKGHREKLEAIKKGKLLVMPTSKVMDLKIAEQIPDVDLKGEFNYQQALTVAMKREKAAYKFYSDLAASVEDDGIRGTLLVLAQEEAKHKLRFEIEYDEHVLSEN